MNHSDTVTFGEALLLTFPVDNILRKDLYSQMLPKWRKALSDHDEENLTKVVYFNGHYKRYRSLPIQMVIDLMKQWREELPDEMKQKMDNALRNAACADCDDVGVDYIPGL
jgi:hypothetical protein